VILFFSLDLIFLNLDILDSRLRQVFEEFLKLSYRGHYPVNNVSSPSALAFN